MKRIAALGVLCACASAHAGLTPISVITQSALFEWDVFPVNDRTYIGFHQFDTMGGTRRLTGVSLSYEASFELELLAENSNGTGLSGGEWFVDPAVSYNFFFLDTYSIGAVGNWTAGSLTADLAASDGVAGSGDDSAVFTFSDVIGGSASVLEEDSAPFIGSGSLEAELYAYLSLGISAPPPFFDFDVTAHSHMGVYTLSYAYEVVPAPSSAAVAAIAGGWLARRRR